MKAKNHTKKPTLNHEKCSDGQWGCPNYYHVNHSEHNYMCKPCRELLKKLKKKDSESNIK